MTKFNIGDKVKYYSKYRSCWVEGIVSTPLESLVNLKGVVWAYWDGKPSRGYAYENEVTLVEPALSYNDEEWI